MKAFNKRGSAAICIALLSATMNTLGSEKIEPEALAYRQVVEERAMKIVETLSIGTERKAIRVRDIIATQYEHLQNLQLQREAATSELETLRAQLATTERRIRFISLLQSELTLEQVDKVKDGMTYGVKNLTYARYLELLPNLENEHKRWMYSTLVEAREHAMDEGSAKLKHARFGKYKGRINIYLSKLGINMKEAERALEKRKSKSAE